MKRLTLKVDVDTFRGTRDGVPRLVEVLRKHGAGATFLFSLGPDHTGRAIKRVFRKGFFGKVKRTSVVSHYGVATLLYGTLLPGPDIAGRLAVIMQAVEKAGFECGIHCYDHIRWQDHVVGKDAAWTAKEFDAARGAFERVFGHRARTMGAAGWQINVHTLRLQQKHSMLYASDTRGTHPFLPVWNGELFSCPQLPTTLPTMDELIGLDGVNEGNVANALLSRTRENGEFPNHVYTLHAELEGGRLLDQFEALLEGWKSQGFKLVSMADYAASLCPEELPLHEVSMAEIPGRSGVLACQGREFPGCRVGEP